MLRGHLQPPAGMIYYQFLQVVLLIPSGRTIVFLHQQVIPHAAAYKSLFNVGQ